MKPYGIPRNLDLEGPDLHDISKYGLKSSKSRVKSKSGDIKNSFRSSASKRSTRRTWKSVARQGAKRGARQEAETYQLSVDGA